MIKHTNNNILFFTPAIGWGILICYFSLLPQQEVPSFLLSMRDFVLHFAIYFALSYLSLFGVNRMSWSKISKSQLTNIIIICSGLGILLEVVQETLVPGRHFQWSDILFNTIGVLLVLPFNRFVLKSPF